MHYEFGHKIIPLERGAKSSDAIVALPGSGLFLVIDGGREELAAEAAQDILLEYLQSIPEEEDYERILDRIREAFEEANGRILEMKAAGCFAEEPQISASVALLRRGAYLVGHLGNTRAFLYRNQILRQLTRDHSAVGDLQRQGLLRKEDMEKHPARHTLNRHLAGPAPQIADLASGELFDGDVVILASDGLIVADEEVIGLIEKIDRSEACAERLAIKARAAGAKDDVSVLMVRVTEVERPEGVDIPQVSPRDTQSLLAAQVAPAAAAAMAAFDQEDEAMAPEAPSSDRKVEVSEALNALEKSMAEVAPAPSPGSDFAPDSPDEIERQKQLLYERFMNYAMKSSNLTGDEVAQGGSDDPSPPVPADSSPQPSPPPKDAPSSVSPEGRQAKSPSEEQKRRISQARPMADRPVSREESDGSTSSSGDIWGRVKLDDPESEDEEPDFLDSTTGVIFCALTGALVVLAIWMY